MCGIFGVIGKDLDVDIKKNLDVIKHRGPDDEGYFNDENIILGFRRLSIVDLSNNGHQPMTNENSSVWLVCNGEIYNFQEIKQELLFKHQFMSNTDVEVLIHGYEEWGMDGLLKKINGMFAFCLYDSVKQESYLVRDRIGKKPLYYYQNKNTISFSSETKTFFKLENFNFEINKEAFDLFMGFSYLPNNKETIINNVHKVPPASYIQIDSSLRLELKKYWEFPEGECDIDFEDAKIKMEVLLVDSVKKRLVADVPIGVLLSGGLDSSLITAIASKNSDKKITTINISFEDSCIDEIKYAELVAKHCSTNHLNLRIKIDDAYADFKKNIWIFDDLSTLDGGLFSEFLLAKKIKEMGIKVVLVGEGADEIFGGYSWFQFAQFPFSILPNFIKSMGYYYATARILLNKNFFKYSSILNNRLSNFSNNYFKKIQRWEIEYSLPNHYCMKVDKGTSAASIEARAPFMDYRIIELATKLNKKFFLKNNFYQPWKANEKYILRKIAEKYLPKEIFSRKKKGGMLPVRDILEVGLRQDADLILNNSFLIDFFGKDYLERLIGSKSKILPFIWQREWILWKCLIFALWYDYYKNA